MYKYTLAFLKRKDEILLLNRNKSPWMGAWNGVGGKIQGNETPLQCVIREIEEETMIQVSEKEVQFKGILTWERFEALGNGLYIFLVNLPEDLAYSCPKRVSEGILDFKIIEWINNFDNEGIAKNIPYFLPNVLYEEKNYLYHCIFNEHYLESVTTTLLEEEMNE